MSDWYALSGHPKWPYVVTREVAFFTPIKGVSFSHKYFSLSVHGVFTIRKGYMWNGCTGVPLWLERMFPALVAASCPHDAGYQAIVLKLLAASFRAALDKLLKALWLKDGLKKSIACTGYGIVRAVGWTRI